MRHSLCRRICEHVERFLNTDHELKCWSSIQCALLKYKEFHYILNEEDSFVSLCEIMRNSILKWCFSNKSTSRRCKKQAAFEAGYEAVRQNPVICSEFLWARGDYPQSGWFSASSARFTKMTWDSDCQIVSFEQGSILLAVKFNHISALGVHP